MNPLFVETPKHNRFNRQFVAFFWLFALLLFTACGGAEVDSGPATHPVFGEVPTGIVTFEHDGLQREYLLHIPDSVGEGAPLVISLHNYGANAADYRDEVKLDPVANRNDFIVAYPVGTQDQTGSSFFNPGYSVFPEESVDDIGFVTELALYLQETYSADSERTFAAGFANGGSMSHSLACQRPDVFKGFISVAGVLLDGVTASCDGAVPVPALIIHGDSDGLGPYQSAVDAAEFWQTNNGCSETATDTIVDANNADEPPVEVIKYQACTDGADVWFYTVKEYDHGWPQGTDFHYFNTSREIGIFLSQF